MNKPKRVSVAVLTLVMLLTAGCSGTVNDPETEPTNTTTIMPANEDNTEAVNTADITLASAQDDTVKVSYPADTWTFQEGITPLTLAYSEALGTDNMCNINIQASQEWSGQLTEKDMDELISAMKEYVGYITINTSEMRLINNEPVIYWESTIQFTEEYLDAMIEAGGLTEADIEAYGGREALLSIPPTTQIMVYATVDNYLFAYVGTYYGDEQKQAVIDALTVIIPNTEKI